MQILHILELSRPTECIGTAVAMEGKGYVPVDIALHGGIPV